MTGIEAWSTTAGSNNAAPPNGAPEGCLPSTINDIIRQNMASVRTWYENPEWQDLGHTPTYVSATSFTVTGDKTSTYTVGRRLKLTGTTPFIVYATITASVFSTVTTITVVNDSGSLDNTLTTVAVGSKTSNPATPRKVYDYATTTGSSNAYVLTLSPPLTAHVIGYHITFISNFANTGAATLNINGLGAVAIKKEKGNALVAGDIPNGAVVTIVYDGTNYQLINKLESCIGRQKISISAGAMRPSVSGGCAVITTIATSANAPDIQSLDFDKDTQEYAQFLISMPKQWDEGTITARFIWCHGSTTTNFGVVWNLQAVALRDGSTIGTAYGTAQQVTDTGGTANAIYTSSETSAITIAGTPQAEDIIMFRVSRVATDGSDTLNMDARLMGIDIYVNTNAGNDA